MFSFCPRNIFHHVYILTILSNRLMSILKVWKTILSTYLEVKEIMRNTQTVIFYKLLNSTGLESLNIYRKSETFTYFILSYSLNIFTYFKSLRSTSSPNTLLSKVPMWFPVKISTSISSGSSSNILVLLNPVFVQFTTNMALVPS